MRTRSWFVLLRQLPTLFAGRLASQAFYSKNRVSDGGHFCPGQRNTAVPFSGPLRRVALHGMLLPVVLLHFDATVTGTQGEDKWAPLACSPAQETMSINYSKVQ
jgi:hypothetical protein